MDSRIQAGQVRSATADARTRQDRAMPQPDERLVASLRRDEQSRRQSRRRKLSGVIIMTLAIAGLLSGAVILFQVTIDDAKRAAALAAEADRLFQQRLYNEAEVKFADAVKLDEKNANAWNGLGWTRMFTGETGAAEEAFKKAITIEARHVGANNGLARTYFNHKDYKSAESQWLKIADEGAVAWWGLTQTYLLTERWEEAAKFAKKALAAQPTDESMKKMLAAAEAKKLDVETRRMIEPMQSSGMAKETEQGWSFFNRGMLKEATAEFEKALAKNDKDGDAHNGLGFCLLNAGKAAEARPHFQKALATLPEHPGVINGLARCLKAEGKTDEAIATWKKIADKSPTANAGTYGLAMTYLELGRYAEAEPYFKQLIAAQPNDPAIADGYEQVKKALASKP